MAVRMREEKRTELNVCSVVAVYHNLLVSEMGSRRTVRVSLCSGLPVGPTRGRWLHGVRKWIGGAEGERHVSGSEWRKNSGGLVASSVLSDTASASALRVCVSGLRGCNLTTD